MKKLKTLISELEIPLTAEVQIVNRRFVQSLESITLDNFSEQRARKVLENIDALVIRFTAFANKWTRKSVSNIYINGRVKTVHDLIKIGYENPKNPGNHQETLVEMQKTVFAYLADAANSMKQFAAKYINSIRDALDAIKQIPAQVKEFKIGGTIDIEDIIEEAIEKKEAVAFTKKGIMRRLLELVESASFVQIGNRTYDLRYYSDMVARTELAKAFTKATLETMKEFGDDLVTYSTHADPCPICAQFEGNIYSISGKSKIYPALPFGAEPPVHPNCGHRLIPLNESESGMAIPNSLGTI